MDIFVKKYQPELYHLWRMGLQVVDRSPIGGGSGAGGGGEMSVRRRLSASLAHNQLTSAGSLVNKTQYEQYLRRVKSTYAEIEFSLYADGPQRRHQIDVKNAILAGNSRLESILNVSDTKNALALFRSMLGSAKSNSLVQVCLHKLIDRFSRIETKPIKSPGSPGPLATICEESHNQKTLAISDQPDQYFKHEFKLCEKCKFQNLFSYASTVFQFDF